LPSELEESILRYRESSDLNIVNLLKQTGRVSSNSEAKRLIEQGGVKIDGQTISDIKYALEPRDGQVLQIGKLFYRKVRYERES
jgi:tyrosyl-tRNA synthetase